MSNEIRPLKTKLGALINFNEENQTRKPAPNSTSLATADSITLGTLSTSGPKESVNRAKSGFISSVNKVATLINSYDGKITESEAAKNDLALLVSATRQEIHSLSADPISEITSAESLASSISKQILSGPELALGAHNISVDSAKNLLA